MKENSQKWLEINENIFKCISLNIIKLKEDNPSLENDEKEFEEKFIEFVVLVLIKKRSRHG